ncbi:hypothetical protein SDC9_168656 [bioreactor metagenome]|uniref:Uncharacterized protein n=1 Tax=bioreactor metagenome TaxID=1076179 RepID=A0A645G322_9ZZZZ
MPAFFPSRLAVPNKHLVPAQLQPPAVAKKPHLQFIERRTRDLLWRKQAQGEHGADAVFILHGDKRVVENVRLCILHQPVPAGVNRDGAGSGKPIEKVEVMAVFLQQCAAGVFFFRDPIVYQSAFGQKRRAKLLAGEHLELSEARQPRAHLPRGRSIA